MNPLLDHLLVATIVLAALLYFVKRHLLRRPGKSCGPGCGCGATRPGPLLPKK